MIRISKISLRLSLATAFVAATVFGVAGWLHLQMEERDLRSVATSQARLLARSLQISTENALRDNQIGDVVMQLGALEAQASEVDVFVYDQDGVEHGPVPRKTSIAEGIRRSAAQEVFERGENILEFRQPTVPGYLLSATPLEVSGERVGSLVLGIPLDRLEADLDATRQSIVIVVLTFITLSTIASLVVGEIYVGRRLMALEQALAAVRRGQLDVRVAPGAHDEVGGVIEEFDRMAEELAKMRTELDKQIASQRATESALQRADKLIAVGRLSAALAHEIGSPLQIIAGRARGLLSSSSDERTSRYAQALANQAERITRIVQRLLTFARQKPAEPGLVRVSESLTDVIALVEMEARRKAVELTSTVADDIPAIIVSGDQVQQVALNLLRNAVEATPAGGRVTLELRAEEQGGVQGVSLVVEDEGCGIPHQIRKHLFEPFLSTRHDHGGTGLGLTVVKAIVDDHEGIITVNGTDGEGTRIVVWLPIRPSSMRVGGWADDRRSGRRESA